MSMTKNENKIYYDVMDDIEAYPDAWCYIVFGGRATGKTYSGLRGAVTNSNKFVYVKRTVKDVQILCAGNTVNKKMQEAGYGVDLSPFKSLNRDFGWNYRAFQIFDGLGAFFSCNPENKPISDPIGYLLSLSSVSKYKGFDLSDCDWMIFDEFVPKIYDRKLRGEGDQILDLYQTISRDREIRGKPALKLICFANADEIASPLTNVLEVTDNIAAMLNLHIPLLYIEDRKIFIHHITDNVNFRNKAKEALIYKAMENTVWGRMALENDFAYNDFSQTGKFNMKNFRPILKYIYKNKTYYVYLKDDTGEFFITDSASNASIPCYDLSKNADQGRLNLDYGIMIRQAMLDDRVKFKQYTQYDLFRNFTKIFNL